MSKRNSDGDVLVNKLSLKLAKSQRILASMLGPAPESHANSTTTPEPNEDEDDFNKESAEPEQLGVGGIRPKDLEDGSFTRRTLTSDDKLLTQMIGAKKAKVHLATKQQMTRLGAQPKPKHGRPVAAKKEDSEDEEEGRAATFKSKRRKTAKPKPAPAPEDDSEDQQALPVQARDDGGEIEQAADDGKAEPPAAEEPEEEERPAPQPKSMPSRGKAKPKSYLDELLAEKSKKKKRKDPSKTVP